MATSYRNRTDATPEDLAAQKAKTKQRAYLQHIGKGGIIDAGPMQARIRELHDRRDIPFQRIAERTGLAPAVVRWHYDGLNRKTNTSLRNCRWATAHAVLTATFTPADAPLVKSTGTTRRLQALSAAGYCLRWLAAETGRDVRRLHAFVHGKQYVSRSFAEQVAGLYEKYADTDPLTVGEPSRAVAYTRSVARKHGWAPSAAWDDDTIDDQDAIPEWTGSCGTERGYRVHCRERIPCCAPCQAAHNAYNRERSGS
ncbi:hypothetical protein [Streptomyces sp. NBC_00233]|uniref:hypothetical protein n=1 Tax=Streptomyces sp. NBC_00233 TaxID=2975686 RepID=UPI00224E0482|nr:hypothetical protein [Streptomyces sp. NBC_00233]MCX5233392.1 hypothetical protein [Streptomyces sp. NBC_00233]